MMSPETKVGLFTILGLCLLGFLTIKVEGLTQLYGATKTYHCRFKTVQGLRENDPVRIAGVKVGEVKEVTIGPSNVDVVVEVSESAPVRTTSVAWIASTSMLAGKCIEISLSNEKGKELPDGGTIATKEQPSLDVLVEKLASNFSSTAESSQQAFRSLTQAGQKLSKFLDSAQDLMSKLDSGKGTLGKLVTDDALYTDLKATVASMRKASDSAANILGNNEEQASKLLSEATKTMVDLREAFASLRKVSDQLAEGKGTLGKLMADPQVYEDMKTTIATLRQVSEKLAAGEGSLGILLNDDALVKHLNEAAENLNEIVAKIKKGQGTIGKLVNDDTLYTEAKETLDEAKEAVKSTKESIPVGAFGSLLFSAF